VDAELSARQERFEIKEGIDISDAEFIELDTK